MTNAGLEERLSLLEAELRQLKDIEEIRTLRIQYHNAMNENRFEDLSQFFAENSILDFGVLGATGEGLETIDAILRGSGILLQFVKQFIHNHEIHVDGDGGTGISYLESRTISSGKAYNVNGRYDDLYVRTEEGWRFAKMKLSLFYSLPFDQGWAQEDLLKMGQDL